MKKKDEIKSAGESLNEILKRIAPYMPKKPKAQQKEPKRWKIVGNGTHPPLNSLGHE